MKITIITFSITLLASIVSSQRACNGYTELCGKLYSDVAYATTHNAYSVGTSVAANQDYDIPTQLRDGIRGLMLDANFPDNNTSEMHLCHQSCNLLDAGKAVDTLSQIVTWLNNNPNEVITIFWENAGKAPPAIYNQVYTQSGLVNFSHIQPINTTWPTLNSMIDSGKRVVNYVDTGADTTTVPWLMEEYDYVFETPFQNTDMNSWQCTVDRPKNQPRPMYVLNHFLYAVLGGQFSSSSDPIEIPQPSTANVTNSANLASHAQTCEKTFGGKVPNFVTVDFYEKGDSQNVMSITANLNNVTYVPKQLGNGTTTSTTKAQNPKSNTNNGVRNTNILAGLTGVGTLAMFVL